MTILFFVADKFRRSELSTILSYNKNQVKVDATIEDVEKGYNGVINYRSQHTT